MQPEQDTFTVRRPWNRAQWASLLTLAWSLIQAWSVLTIGPRHHLVAWLLCGVFLAISAGLWLGTSWAKYSFLILGSVLVIIYVGAAYSFRGLPCGEHALSCYTYVMSQPVLLVATFAVLLFPWISNNRSWRGP